MENDKVATVASWPEPQSVKDLQRFLGFSNFYHRFIRNVSAVAAPLMDLLKGKPKCVTFNPDTWHAFQKLKDAFTGMPILKLPNPERAFLIEVDASEVGLGAERLQYQMTPKKLAPSFIFANYLCKFFANYHQQSGITILAIANCWQ